MYANVLSEEDIHYLNNLPEVLVAKASLDSRPSGVVRFSVTVTDEIRATLESRFGLALSAGASIPMRWIKGDTAPHVDVGRSKFDNTYLMYLNDSPGEFIVDSQTFPIQANTGFVFNEGVRHETQHTDNVPRLLLGPMNELAEPVGSIVIRYYLTRQDAIVAIDDINSIHQSDSYVVETQEDITSWRIAPNYFSYGSSPYGDTDVYDVGDTLDSPGLYYLYPSSESLVGEPPFPNVINGIYYYATQSGALNAAASDFLGYSDNYNVSRFGEYNSWLLSDAVRATGSPELTPEFPFIFSDNLLDGAISGVYILYVLSPIVYYSSESDAENPAAIQIGRTINNTTVQSINGITRWEVAARSTGLSRGVYNTGAIEPDPTLTFDASVWYYLYPAEEAPCFLEGSTILCKVDGADKYVPVEQLKKGTLVKTSLHGYKPVVLIGKGKISNPGNSERTENRLYKCSPSKYPELTKDLFITGCHSILEFPITEKQKEDITKRFGRLFVTDRKYRLMACVDERAEPWNSKGTYTIWHFALEHENEGMNYGVYANGKLLVETCCIQTLRNKSNMTLLG